MSFRLIETLSLAGKIPNEDAFAFDAHAALVMDGTTPLGETLMPGASDAAWLAQFGTRRLMAHLKDGDAPKDALTHALADAQKSFSALSRRPVREKWETPYATMMLVVERGADLEFLWFGDCSALISKTGACEIIGDGFDRRGEESERVRRLTKEKNLSPAPDLNRPEILSALRAARNKVGSGSYWLFGPDPRAAAHVRRHAVKNKAGALLLLASDGFMALATDYGAYDAAGLVAAAKAKGLARLGEELRAIEEEDALGEKFPRFKKSDDATALLLEVI